MLWFLFRLYRKKQERWYIYQNVSSMNLFFLPSKCPTKMWIQQEPHLKKELREAQLHKIWSKNLFKCHLYDFPLFFRRGTFGTVPASKGRSMEGFTWLGTLARWLTPFALSCSCWWICLHLPRRLLCANLPQTFLPKLFERILYVSGSPFQQFAASHP